MTVNEWVLQIVKRDIWQSYLRQSTLMRNHGIRYAADEVFLLISTDQCEELAALCWKKNALEKEFRKHFNFLIQFTNMSLFLFS